MINIRFQKKDIGAAIFNSFLIALGLLLFYLALTKREGLVYPGLILFAIGIYPFSKSKGVLVDTDKKELYHYTATLWIKSKHKLQVKDYGSIVVTTGTEVHKGGVGTLVNTKRTVSFMVYKLFLIPDPYLKIDKAWLGDFYTKKECLMAAEKLAEITGLTLTLKIRS